MLILIIKNQAMSLVFLLKYLLKQTDNIETN